MICRLQVEYSSVRRSLKCVALLTKSGTAWLITWLGKDIIKCGAVRHIHRWGTMCELEKKLCSGMHRCSVQSWSFLTCAEACLKLRWCMFTALSVCHDIAVSFVCVSSCPCSKHWKLRSFSCHRFISFFCFWCIWEKKIGALSLSNQVRAPPSKPQSSASFPTTAAWKCILCRNIFIRMFRCMQSCAFCDIGFCFFIQTLGFVQRHVCKELSPRWFRVRPFWSRSIVISQAEIQSQS